MFACKTHLVLADQDESFTAASCSTTNTNSAWRYSVDEEAESHASKKRRIGPAGCCVRPQTTLQPWSAPQYQTPSPGSTTDPASSVGAHTGCWSSSATSVDVSASCLDEGHALLVGGEQAYRSASLEVVQGKGQEHGRGAVESQYNNDAEGSPQEDFVCYGMLTDWKLSPCADTPPEMSQPSHVVVVDGKNVSLQTDHKPVATLDSRDADVLRTMYEQNWLAVDFSCSTHRSAGRIELRLAVTVYGPADLLDDIADHLENCESYLQRELFLQDPLPASRNVPYRNPQCLWSAEEGIERMANDAQIHDSIDVQDIERPEDLLADLETCHDFAEEDTPPALRTPLYTHQRQALAFMKRRENGWDFSGRSLDVWRVRRQQDAGISIFENIMTEEQIVEKPAEFRGGILADSMGLGKTLTIIALIASDDREKGCLPRQGRVPGTLLVVRAPLIHTWSKQLSEHLHTDTLRWTLHYGKKRIDPTVMETADIVLTTYQTIVAEWKRQSHEPRPLFDALWRRIVLDEGQSIRRHPHEWKEFGKLTIAAHDIRDHTRVTSKALCSIEAYSRWAVTGTPIQNRLLDVASLYKFLRMNPYDDVRTFQYDVNRLNARFGAEEAHERLKRFIRCTMLRRSIGTVTLPTRHDMKHTLDFSKAEADLYNEAENTAASAVDAALSGDGYGGRQVNVLTWINTLRMICNLGTHAKLPKATSTDEKWDERVAQELFNSLVTAGIAKCNRCSTDLGVTASEVADETGGDCDPGLTQCSYLLCGPCRGNIQSTQQACEHGLIHSLASVSTLSSRLSFATEDAHCNGDLPSKIHALMQDLARHTFEEKCVVFSFWTSTLDIIEECLRQSDVGYVRFDGKVSNAKRGSILKRIQEDDSVRVALMTISCGAVGLDLTAASRVYLMEPHWNPSVEEQALARVYRIGQKRPVTTIRYIMRNSFEENVLRVQDRKQRLTDILLPPISNAQRDRRERLEQFRDLIVRPNEGLAARKRNNADRQPGY